MRKRLSTVRESATKNFAQRRIVWRKSFCRRTFAKKVPRQAAAMQTMPRVVTVGIAAPLGPPVKLH